MKRVYRVVDSDGCGMYRNRNGHKPAFYAAIGNDDVVEAGRHPCAWSDGLMCLNWPEFAYRKGLNPSVGHMGGAGMKSHLFGFESLHSLKRWLYGNGWIKALHDHGCVVNVYDVPADDVLIGRCQVTFDSMTAIALPDLSLLDIGD